MRFALVICMLALLRAPVAFGLPADGPAPLPAPAAVHPVEGKVGYGEWAAHFGNFRRGHVHEGQDVFAPAGTYLRAIRDSLVVETGSGDGRGNYIALYSAEFGETYVYLHMLHPTFRRVGDHLDAGEHVGRLGCSGSCDGDHLHFEVRAGRGVTGRASDPLHLLKSLR